MFGHINREQCTPHAFEDEALELERKAVQQSESGMRMQVWMRALQVKPGIIECTLPRIGQSVSSVNGRVSHSEVYYDLRRTPKKTVLQKGEVLPKREFTCASPRRLRLQS